MSEQIEQMMRQVKLSGMAKGWRSVPFVDREQYLLAGKGDAENQNSAIKPLSVSGKRVRAVPEEWTGSFGNQYYLHQHIFPPIESQSENDWKIRMEGQLFETGEKIHVTGFDELKRFINLELSRDTSEEKVNEQL